MADPKLIDYAKKGLAKGYSEEELSKILRESGWTDLEISSAFNEIKKVKPVASKPEKKSVMDKTKIKDQILINFIQASLNKGINEDKIRESLLSKNWPPEKINAAFSKVSKPVLSTQEKPIQEEYKPKRKGFDWKTLLIYIGVFFVITIILSLSIGVFYYIQGMKNYEITDPNTGERVKGYCLVEDCSDMKEYIFNNIQDNLALIFIISIILSLVLTLSYFFIPYKEMIIWIANIGFFLFICFMLYMWLMAN